MLSILKRCVSPLKNPLATAICAVGLAFVSILFGTISGYLALSNSVILFLLVLSYGIGIFCLVRTKYGSASGMLISGTVLLLTLFGGGERYARYVIYGASIFISHHYESACQPQEGIAVNGATVKICAKYDFNYASFVDLVVKIDGPRPAQEILDEIHEGNVVPLSSKQELIAIGEIWPKSFQYRHILGQYYLLTLRM